MGVTFRDQVLNDIRNKVYLTLCELTSNASNIDLTVLKKLVSEHEDLLFNLRFGVCPICGREFNRVWKHLNSSECGRKFSKIIEQIAEEIIGV